MSYLNPALHKNWKTNGYLKISRFFSAEEVGDLQAWVSEISDWEPTSDKWMHHYESTPDGARLSRSENFVPYHTDMKATVTSGKVLAVVSELMEESAVLYKEKINYKYPGWRRLCRPSGRARLRIYRLPYHVSDLSRSSHNKKRMPLFFTGQASGRIYRAGRKGLRCPRNCLSDGVGRRADRSWRHSPFRILYPS